MKKIKRAVALGLAGTMAFSMLPGMGVSCRGENEDCYFLLSCR